MKTLLLLLALFISWGAASAVAKDSAIDPIFTQFSSALGYPDARTAETLKSALTANWVGKSRDEVQVYIRRVIQNRGDLGATKSNGWSPKPDFLALSHSSVLTGKETAWLRLHFHYDKSGKVSHIEFESKM